VIEGMLVYRSRLDGADTSAGVKEAAFAQSNFVP
jgi:hypothetical protein